MAVRVLSAALGCTPARGWRKGDPRVFPKSGRVAIERTGGRTLGAEDREPEDLPAQTRPSRNFADHARLLIVQHVASSQ